MSITIATLKAAGLTAEQIVAVLEAAEAAKLEKKREGDRVRQANKRARDRERVTDVTLVTRDECDARDTPSPQVSPPSMVSPITPSLTTPPSSPPSHIRAVAGATRPAIDEDFQKFWEVYPKRDGANPKAPARKAFLAALKAGTEVSAIVAGAGEFARRESERIGTPYIAQAVTWLRQRRWEDYAAPGQPVGVPSGLTPEQIEDWKRGWRPGMPSSAELRKRMADEQAARPRDPVAATPPVDEAGLRLGGEEQRVARDQPRQPGMQGLGGILRKVGLGSVGVSPVGQVGEGMDGPGPVADVAFK